MYRRLQHPLIGRLSPRLSSPFCDPVAVDDALAGAADVVERLRSASPWVPAGGVLDSVDVVHVGVGQQVGQAYEPGVRMKWHQGESRFGLLMSIRRLAEQSAGIDSVPFYLQFAVDEPHEGAPDGSRVWFVDLPSAPY